MKSHFSKESLAQVNVVWAWRTNLTRRRPCWRCTSPQQPGFGWHCLWWHKWLPRFRCCSLCIVQWPQCSCGGWWHCQLEPGRWCWCRWCCGLRPGRGAVGRAQLGLHQSYKPAQLCLPQAQDTLEMGNRLRPKILITPPPVFFKSLNQPRQQKG